MKVFLTEFSSSAGILKFIALLIVFIGVLFLAYWFTRWYAKSGVVGRGAGNVRVVESCQPAPGKNIFIIKVGGRFVAVMTSKDNMIKLAELSEDELVFSGPGTDPPAFKDVMADMIKGRAKKQKKMKDEND